MDLHLTVSGEYLSKITPHFIAERIHHEERGLLPVFQDGRHVIIEDAGLSQHAVRGANPQSGPSRVKASCILVADSWYPRRQSSTTRASAPSLEQAVSAVSNRRKARSRFDHLPSVYAFTMPTRSFLSLKSRKTIVGRFD